MPLPGVAPILVAALPIGESNNAEDLVLDAEKILRGLIALGIQVASYSCDGTELERKVQRLLIQIADEHMTYTIPSPRGGPFSLTITIAIFNGCPVVMIQDSKHGLKTFQNNLFSGACLLVLGDWLAIYQHIHDMAFHPHSPLYQRDVERVDRQDDNAACRLFSSHSMAHLTTEHPQFIGEAVYLFVFGELIDAYQNRHVSLSERLKMLLRTYYFVTMWRVFLDRCKYPATCHFVSREAADIIQTLITGLIGLILVYRDFYNTSTPFPLLPWLHLTEPCEHTFGTARQQVADFTITDFYHMITKLRVKIRNAVILAEISNAKKTASGYNHTYVHSRNLDLFALSTYPQQSDLPPHFRCCYGRGKIGRAHV